MGLYFNWISKFAILQKGRTRKCSIVQEGDEDDEDEAECDESSLNRRGSRSEGRINLAVQDRLSLEVAERLKKDQVVITKKKEDEVTLNKVTVKVIDGIGGIKIIKNNTDSSKEKFLGMAGGGNRTKEVRSASVDKIVKTSRKEGDIIHTKILTESSTIHIPVSGTIISGNQIIPKYKTMPSPTRPNALISGANNSLKEIFEEGDAGSCGSDNSNTNTPKPIIRNSHLNQSPVAGSVAGASDRSHHRRTKFQKSRTTSCSSSDASDDDNAENRKKRANKIIDSASAKQFTQRRDSHDDSSDSQDPGTACSGNGTAATASSLILRCSNGSTTTTNSTNNNQNRNETRGKSSSNSQDLSYRRHRAGRRRPVETRLRESQSLNRITEVQECELQAANNQNQAEKVDKSKDEEGAGREEAIASKVEHLNNKNTDNNNILKAVEVPVLVVDSKVCKNHTNIKTKSFSARILQNLNFKKTSSDGTVPSGKLSKSNRNPSNNLDVPLLKLNNSKNQQPLVNEGSTKKIKILGRYFQVSLSCSCLRMFEINLSLIFRSTKRSVSHCLAYFNVVVVPEMHEA